MATAVHRRLLIANLKDQDAALKRVRLDLPLKLSTARRTE